MKTNRGPHFLTAPILSPGAPEARRQRGQHCANKGILRKISFNQVTSQFRKFISCIRKDSKKFSKKTHFE